MTPQDVLVVGAGIAGLSLASELAPRARVTVLDMETQPAYHSSGRSAATYIEPYDNFTVANLTMASKAFFDAPPNGFSDVPLVHPRGGLTLCPADQVTVFERFLAVWAPHCPALREIGIDEACRLVPVLRRDYLHRVALDSNVLDIDVHALIEGHRKRVLVHAGRVLVQQEVIEASRRHGRWHVLCAGGTRFVADVLVNAAGAWSDVVAARAGVRGIGLQPKRRTACLIDAPATVDASGWPMVHDAISSFYFRPESGRLMVSPADKTPSEPCDAQPEELDVALAVDRAQAAAHLPVRRVVHRWAGLRSFVADDRPVSGYAPDEPSFYWLAGHGGFGVQTSPAMARIAAARVLGEPIPDYLRQRGLTETVLGPERLANSAALG